MLLGNHRVGCNNIGCVKRRSLADVIGFAWVHHRLVLLDAMGRLKYITILSGLTTVRAPSKEVSADLDVVIREFAVLIVIHTKELSLFRGTELQSRNEVDDLSNDGRHDEGISGGSDNGSDLPANNDVVSIHEATCSTGVDAVEANDGATGEKSIEDEANDTTDTVLGKDIERVVNSNKELDCV